MADGRNLVLLRAYVNGYPVMASLEGFTPPPVEKVTEEYKGGRYIAEKRVIGVTLGDWTLTLVGADADIIGAMGLGDDCEVTVLGSVRDENGESVPQKYEVSGECTSADEGDLKPGKQSTTLKGSPYAFTKTEGSRVVHDINTRTQKAVVGGKDLLANDRRNVDL